MAKVNCNYLIIKKQKIYIISHDEIFIMYILYLFLIYVFNYVQS